MTATDDMLSNAQSYALGFDRGELPAPPAKKVAIVACMDARIDLHRIFGLDEGDAHVIRNAGGVVTDEEIRSLAISQHELGTEEVVLLHHTKCGMQTFTDEEFAGKLEEKVGERPSWDAHAFHDLDTDLRQAADRIKQSPFIPHGNVRAFVFDVETGRLREVTV